MAWSTWLISDIKQANDRPHYGEPQPQLGPLCEMRDAAAVKQSSRENFGAQSFIGYQPEEENEGAPCQLCSPGRQTHAQLIMCDV